MLPMLWTLELGEEWVEDEKGELALCVGTISVSNMPSTSSYPWL